MYSVSVPVKVGRVRGGVADEGGLSRGGLLYQRKGANCTAMILLH